ncbi:keratin-associated protein 4-3-like isoform X2 [Acipenser ruthenus]|uniref:keratin-associated protein 4-3-like isoform X2 n=1 Tax=Acipenser ruthenus TaxID=7906 RepID=UPI002740FD4B|nr:keratin-associated protein 4-3-like isoform X2 [Acipenser ruthenus]
MKVVLGILVLLHCAAQVQTLSCLTCAAGTADEATCTTQVCAGGESWCFNTHTVTGSTITVEKGCALTCVPDPTTICCNTIDCNVQTLSCYTCAAGTDEASCTTITYCAGDETWCFNTHTVTGSTITVEKGCATTCEPDPTTICCNTIGCNEILICFKCDETTDESSCTPSPCAAATFCQSDYKLNGAGVPVVIKSCAADCKAVDNTADKNVRTTCCKTGYCNGNALSCNTCSNEADEPECAATACAATDKLCQSTYTLTAPDVPVSKACAEACTPSATVKCCGTSQCNVDLLKCYTCTDLTDESNCKDITVCGYGDKFCKTTYKLTGTGK